MTALEHAKYLMEHNGSCGECDEMICTNCELLGGDDCDENLALTKAKEFIEGSNLCENISKYKELCAEFNKNIAEFYGLMERMKEITEKINREHEKFLKG